MNIPDHTKYEQMIKNRPPLSAIPFSNKRLVSQYITRSLFTTAAVGLTIGILFYKFALSSNTALFVNSRKSFRFESDPYTEKVSCTYQDRPKFQHGY